MKDTKQHIYDLQMEIINSKTAEQRTAMGVEMIDFAYYIIRNQIMEEEGLTGKPLIAEIFKRFYKNDFTKKESEKMIADLMKN